VNNSRKRQKCEKAPKWPQGSFKSENVGVEENQSFVMLHHPVFVNTKSGSVRGVQNWKTQLRVKFLSWADFQFLTELRTVSAHKNTSSIIRTFVVSPEYK
jgi:hypothetical protein